MHGMLSHNMHVLHEYLNLLHVRTAKLKNLQVIGLYCNYVVSVLDHAW